MKLLKTSLLVWTLVVGHVLGGMAQGKVTFEESPVITAMVDKFVDNNLANATMKGWRIQIISTDNRREMEEARARLSSLYPHISSSWKHVSPYYQLRIGAYREKNDLIPFLAELKKEFPSATPVMDDFAKFDLISY